LPVRHGLVADPRLSREKVQRGRPRPIATYETPVIADAPRTVDPARRHTRRPPPFVAEGDDALGGSGLAALGLIAAALIVFLVQLPGQVRELYASPDVTGLPQLVTLMDGVPADRVVTLSNAPEYEWLAILRATDSWPAHWALWLVIPFVLTAIGFALVARTMWTTWGRWAAVLSVAALVVVAGGLRVTLLAIDAHAVSILSMVVLGTVLVAFARRPPRTVAGWVLPGIALIALIGPGTPDPQLLLTGIVPFVGAGIALWRLSGDPAHRRLAAFAVVVGVGAVGVGLLLAAAMHADHVSTWPGFQLQYATLDRLPVNVSLIFGGLFELAGTAPSIFGQPIDRDSTLDALIGAPVVLGFACALWWGLARVRRQLAADLGPVRVERPDRLVFVLFWTAVVGLSLLACELTNSPKPSATGRYLIPAFYGVVMLAPALAGSRRMRGWVAIGVLVFAAGVVGRHALQGPDTFAYGPSADTAHAVEDYVAAQHATVGYAGWGDAGPLVWQSRGTLKVYPVTNQACSNELCEGPLMKVSSWYMPRDGVRSYLVEGFTPHDAQAMKVPATAGAPIAQAQIGTVRVSIYDHDLARDLGSPLATVPVGS
jgi:hypothetical protein